MARVILSTNYNNDYLFFTPLTAYMWRRFGFSTVLFMPYSDKPQPLADLALKYGQNFIDTTVYLNEVEGVKEETVVQCSRMYAACLGLHPEEYIITGDIDMFILSDYIMPYKTDNLYLYGHDLTGYGQYPICYVGGKVKVWRELMNIKEVDWNGYIKRDLNEFGKSKSDRWEDYWGVDQDILTDRIKKYNGKKEEITRGHSLLTGLPVGRVDRHDWAKTLQEPYKVDAHLLRPGYTNDNFNKILSLMQSTLPNDNLSWVVEYREEYLKLME